MDTIYQYNVLWTLMPELLAWTTEDDNVYASTGVRHIRRVSQNMIHINLSQNVFTKQKTISSHGILGGQKYSKQKLKVSLKFSI